MMFINNCNLKLLKYADDMALVGLLREDDATHEEAYFKQVTALQDWCQASKLEMNVSKTKELIIQTKSEGDDNMVPVIINNQPIEKVKQFKYLGTIIDQSLTFSHNTDYIYKKANQRLYLIRKLRSFGVSQHILITAYRSLVETVLSYNMTAWYGNLNVKNKNKLSKIVKIAGKLTGKPQKQLCDIFDRAVNRKARKISGDASHPLNSAFELLPSGRRYRVPRASRNIYKKSFIPCAILALNK